MRLELQSKKVGVGSKFRAKIFCSFPCLDYLDRWHSTSVPVTNGTSLELWNTNEDLAFGLGKL